MEHQYSSYRKLSTKQKQKLIDQAEQCQMHRKPNPQGAHEFHQYQPINFEVKQGKKTIKLHTYRHNAKDEPKAIMLMLHGLNSHIGHGAHLAHQLSLYQITTVGFDYRGFGRSEGEPGFIESLDQQLEDVKAFCNIIKHMYKGLPMFCMGLSLGGLTAYHMTLRYPEMFQGAILMAPALKNSVGGFLVGVTKTLAKIMPTKSRLTKPFYGRAAKNPTITQDVQNDKWAFADRACLSTINMLVSVMDESPKTFKHYNSPFMIIQGGLDKMVNPQVAFELYDYSKTKPQDKELLFYQKMWHDVWHEEEIHEIMDHVIEWVLKRLKLKEEKVNEISNQGFSTNP